MTTQTPTPKDRPIVDPDELKRHDDNPNWDQQHGGRR